MGQAQGLGTLLVYVPHIFSEGVQAHEVAQATGSEVSRIEPPAGKSLIYIYGEKHFKGGGKALLS